MKATFILLVTQAPSGLWDLILFWLIAMCSLWDPSPGQESQPPSEASIGLRFQKRIKVPCSTQAQKRVCTTQADGCQRSVTQAASPVARGHCPAQPSQPLVCMAHPALLSVGLIRQSLPSPAAVFVEGSITCCLPRLVGTALAGAESSKSFPFLVARHAVTIKVDFQEGGRPRSCSGISIKH